MPTGRVSQQKKGFLTLSEHVGGFDGEVAISVPPISQLKTSVTSAVHFFFSVGIEDIFQTAASFVEKYHFHALWGCWADPAGSLGGLDPADGPYVCHHALTEEIAACWFVRITGKLLPLFFWAKIASLLGTPKHQWALAQRKRERGDRVF